MSLPEDQDERLWGVSVLARIAHSDEAAFAEFYQRYGGVFFSLAMRMMRDAQDAEDVVQDALTTIWRKAATYDSTRSSAFSWCVMIVRHKAIDRIRGRQRVVRTAEAATLDLGALTDNSEQGAKLPILHERSAQVRSALGQIPAEQRHALELAFFTGLTQEEIAAQLATPLGTIKARIRRGLLKLRTCLKEVQ